MTAQRSFGMDHPHHEWSPIISRPSLRWPENAPVALCVILVLEHMEWEAPDGSFQVANLSGGSAPRAFPDYARVSHREYGHRVGIFRLLDVLEKHGIRPTIAMDAITAENYPYLVRHCLDRGCEVIGHGISVSRMITSNMTEGEEREYIQTSIDAVTRATGTAPRGWLGPEYGESQRTPQLWPRPAALRLRLGQRRTTLSDDHGGKPLLCAAHTLRAGRRSGPGPAEGPRWSNTSTC